MDNTITSKNRWELLLSSIAGAFDGADVFIHGTFNEAENYRYKTVITNHRTNEEISNYIASIKLTIPDSGDKITSIKATFDLKDLVVQNDDYITIKILNSIESAEVTILKGKAKILKRDLNKINLNLYSIEIVNEFNKLFEKVVSEDIFLFDKYIYSEQYKENSILYIIAKKLGFIDEQMNFEDIRDSQSRLVKVPFMLFRKGNRYIDELQTVLDVTKGRMYVDNIGEIVFQNGLFESEKDIVYFFDTRNILRNIRINYKYTEKNGIRVVYDSYKYLANQVIFDLANKVEILPGANILNAKEFIIKFITDLAVQHNITKAEGYYYENEQQIRISLQEGVHYELIEFSETLAKVKFLNPYTSKFYIDKFEIKGVPLAMFSDNEVSVKTIKDMTKDEENFSSYNKNKYIQTEKLASDIARVEYIRKCKNKKEYSFKASFVPHLEPGDICSLKIEDIDCLIQILTVEHTISRDGGFYSEITATEYEKLEQEFYYTKIESLTAKDYFLETLNNIKDKVDEADKKLEEVILIEGARGFISKIDPSLEKKIKEPDVWFNPTTKEFKVWRNKKWNSAREEDIPPALMVALKAQAGVFRIGENEIEAGIFFQYDKDNKNTMFGTTDSENLAEVSIDKEANVLIRNANNRLGFNMKNPENPSEIISQLLMGVYDADDTERHKNTLFQVGDESTGAYIKFTRENMVTITYDGKEVKQHIKNSMAKGIEALDKLDKIASDEWLTASEKTILDKEWEEIKQEFPKVRDRGIVYDVDVQAYENSKNALDSYLFPMLNTNNLLEDTQINRVELNSKFINYYDSRTNIFVNIEENVKKSAITGANGYADKIIQALGSDLINQIDEKINTYSQNTNPGIEWTEEEMLKAIGDLWYDPTTKITRRWNGNFWEDQDNIDKIAQEIAKSKSTIFVSTPIPPYKIGDLWINNQEIYDCILTRETGSFIEDDWEKSIKYTDDTIANEAKQEAQQAKDQAALINQKVESYASDEVITPSEKAELKREVDTIEQEINLIVNRATDFGISIGNIWSAWSDLAWWRENILIVTGNYAGDVNSLRDVFKNYYNERQGIFDRIERKAKELADNAQNTGDTAINNQNNGVFTVNANTIFAGDATFISNGSNETTIIRDGSISFTRGEETITTIRNMRAGTIITDGYGNGYVDFIGMKDNLFILPSIKAFDVSANVRSLNCKVEKDPNFLAQNRYKFFVYGTEEVYEGINKEIVNSQNYTQNAYSVGIEAVEISLYGARICENFWTTNSNENTYWSDVFISGTASPCQIGVKVYINDSYYGESVYDINHSYCSLEKDGSYHYLRIDVPRVKISLGNFSLTTKDKNNKIVRVEIYLKSNPIIICSGAIWEYRSGRDRDYWTSKPYSGNIICNVSSVDITFYVGYYFYSPSYIQNIVGGGEVQYLAIEQ